MTRRPIPIHGHHPDGTPDHSPQAIAGTIRAYTVEDIAPTRDAVLAARGWDQRHRRYRRSARPRPHPTREAS